MNTSSTPILSSDGTRERVVGDVERFLCEMIYALEPEPIHAGPGRPLILPALVLWGGLLVWVLRGFTSQLDLWRLLTLHQLWFYPRFLVGDQAIYARLENGETTPLEDLFTQTSQVLADRPAP